MKWMIGVVLFGAVFGAGFLTGRGFPARHYERLAGDILFDSSTGRMCSVRGDTASPTTDPFAAYAVSPPAPVLPKNPLPACNAQ